MQRRRPTQITYSGTPKRSYSPPNSGPSSSASRKSFASPAGSPLNSKPRTSRPTVASTDKGSLLSSQPGSPTSPGPSDSFGGSPSNSIILTLKPTVLSSHKGPPLTSQPASPTSPGSPDSFGSSLLNSKNLTSRQLRKIKRENVRQVTLAVEEAAAAEAAQEAEEQKEREAVEAEAKIKAKTEKAALERPPSPPRLPDLYAILGVSMSATSSEIKAAYFKRACDYHPDLVPQGDQTAMQIFTEFSKAFWVLSDGGRRELYDDCGSMELESFSMNVILKKWLWEFAMEDKLGVDEMITETLQCVTKPDRLQRFAEAGTSPVGLILGERLRCEVCGFQVRGHALMREHFSQRHADDAEDWGRMALGHAKASFRGFMEVAAGIPLVSSFIMPNQSKMNLRPSRFGELNSSIETELERCLADPDPCSAEAVAAAIEAAPPEVREALVVLRAYGGAGVSAYIAPSEENEPDIAASSMVDSFVMDWEALKCKTSDVFRPDQQGQKRRAGRRQAADEADTITGNVAVCGCVCGYTCGTAAALTWHLARHQGDPAHREQFQQV